MQSSTTVYAGLFLYFFYDILVCSRTLEEHHVHLVRVLEILASHQLYANKKTRQFRNRQVEYLGHIISGDGVMADMANVEAMLH